MWKEWLAEYWFEAACALVLGTVTAYVKKKLKEYKQEQQEQQTIRDASVALLRIEIVKMYQEYTEKGWIPILMLEVLDPAYQAYTKLGGNGLVPDMYKTLKRLPNQPPERSCGNACLHIPKEQTTLL